MRTFVKHTLVSIAAITAFMIAMPASTEALPQVCKERRPGAKTVFFYGENEFLLEKCWELTPVNETLLFTSPMPQELISIGYRVYQDGEEVHRVQGSIKDGELRLSNGARMRIESHEPIHSVMKRVKALYKRLYLKNSYQV